ncbi:hypothetical protein [Paenibacillus dendritiformis]|uniref:hypothetical protein n=1 Tax=Paenibacillus dendritiformis TaxID=130049 RepID=UPI001F550E65|nr:hypothetical protein [Paenibacillus dendritiformis]
MRQSTCGGEEARPPARMCGTAVPKGAALDEVQGTNERMTGETIGDYIRKRSLTEASLELMGTRRPILDIAVDISSSRMKPSAAPSKRCSACLRTPSAARGYGRSSTAKER